MLDLNMNAKNLPLKFSFVALLVAVCLGSLFFGGGLKQGIDLRGGHSLVFEVRTNKPQIDRLTKTLKDRQDELQAAEAAGQTDKAEQLREAIDRDAEQLEVLKGESRARGDLVNRIIRILKDRIDPEGLRSLEWRPLGENRIEVRMPAAGEKTQNAKDAFRRAMDELGARNIRRSDIIRLCRSSGQDRATELARLVAKAPDQSERLASVAGAYDRMIAAEQTKDKIAAKAGQGDKLTRELAEAMDKFVSAKSQYQEAHKAVLDGNIDPAKMQTILDNYVTASEAEALNKRKGGQAEIDRRRETRAAELARLRQTHPSRAGQIDTLVQLYEAWADARQRLEDPADLKRLIAKAGVLEFRVAPGLPAEMVGGETGYRLTGQEYNEYLESLQTEGPEALRRRNAAMQWFAIRDDVRQFSGLVTGSYGTKDYILLCNRSGKVMLSDRRAGGWKLTKALADVDEFGRLAIGFRLNGPGAQRMAKLTGGNIGNHMAILLDDEVYSAPTVRTTISDRGLISGRFSRDEVDELVRTLEAGSLPARLNPDPVSENTFGPSIGEVNRRMGIRAAYWGLIAVAGFMLIYYLLSGFIADVALLLNIILVLGAMSLLSAVFTLPGIAGVILTIGIAVDANVLIFERLREEQAKSQSVRMCLKNAYDRAFSAIFDANITTVITCLILAWIGTEEVRGFGITLGLGVAFSMFTSLVVTRWVFQLLLDTKLLKRPVFMLRLIRIPRINWMSKRYFFWGLSVVLMVMGVGSLIWQGGDILGIEFSAGTQAIVKFKDDALIGGELPNDSLVGKLFVAQARELRVQDPRYGKLADTARVEKQIDPNRAIDFMRDHDTDQDGKITLAEWLVQGGDEEFFAKLDAGSVGALTAVELAERLPSNSYQVSTTETTLSLIRETARKAFGKQLQQIAACDFALVKGGGEVAQLGLTVADDGLTRFAPEPDSPYWDIFEDFKDGVLLVIGDVTPALSEAQLRQRIRDMRYQPDFGGQLNPTEVIGLSSAGKEGYSSFAIFVRPSEAMATETSDAWRQFAQNESDLLAAALSRSEAMLAMNFDAAIAGEAVQRAIFAIIVSWLAIVLYLWLRFGSIQWGLAAVICLIHDVIIVVGLLAASGWLHETIVGRALGIGSFKLDLAMVAAILTVIGYSVNDTIVVFDRIRENRGKLATVSGEVINASINQTLPRTLLTSATTFLVVLIMYVAGGPGMHAFNFALLAGIVFGTYSSVAVASPILMGFKRALVERVTGV